jgi:hypothetical protein
MIFQQNRGGASRPNPDFHPKMQYLGPQFLLESLSLRGL